MKSIIAKNTWFAESDLRLDASYHLSDTNRIKHLFSTLPYQFTTIQEQSEKIFSGNIFKRIYVKDLERGIPYITGSDMIKQDIDSGKFISKKQAIGLQNLMLEKGWVLVSCSGTLGNTVYTSELFSGRIATHDLIRIIPNNKEVKSGFLYAYLSTKYGYTMLTQSSYGGVIKHIEPHHIANIPVPIFPPEKHDKIHLLITEATNLREEAFKTLNLALTYFDTNYQSYLGYKTIFTKNVKQLGFSWVGRNNDVFAEEVSKKIKSDGHILINQIAEKVFAPPMFKHIYLSSDNGYVFYTGADLSKSFRRPSRFLSKKGVNRISDYVVNENQVLVYKSGPRDGMLGSVFLTDHNIKGSCLSDHVIRIQIQDEILRNWVFAFLKSKVGLRQLHNIATGTAILFITPERLAAMAIPELDDNCNKISDFIREYKNLNERAFLLEETALSYIEKEIEQWQN